MRDDAAGALRLDDEMLARPYERRFERTTPARAYGTHRRADAPPVSRGAGAPPARRPVETRGQARAPRRRSQTQAALVARPDRTAQWAFLFALFLLVMAIVT